MSRIVAERICKHCNGIFFPDWRNRHRQRFCQKPECRKASHAESQARWLARNPDYFRGSHHIAKTQQWRQAHPGYAQRRAGVAARPLPEILPLKPADSQIVTLKPALRTPEPLQDVCRPLQDFIISNPLIIGLLAHQFDCMLQEDIEYAVRQLISKGMAILGTTPGTQKNPKIQTYDTKETPPS